LVLLLEVQSERLGVLPLLKPSDSALGQHEELDDWIGFDEAC